jgi:hypothetical protein
MSRSEIATEGSTLDNGQSARMVCPFCGGGNGERSMSIKRDEETGLILYHCFRANCGESGVLGGSRSLVRTRQQTPPAFVPWNTTGLIDVDAVMIVPSGVRAQLDEWGLCHRHPLAGWKWDPFDDRICMPILGPLGDLRGYVRRSYRKGSDGPKALIGRIDNQHPLVSYLFPSMITPPEWVYCVEDIPSATRLCHVGKPAVALLGCTPSEDVLAELARVCRYNLAGAGIVIALDADASRQALRLQRQYGMRGESTVRFLHKDVKNMTRGELDAWLTSAI